MDKKKYETKVLDLPFPLQDPYGSIAMPVYNTLSFEFDTAEEMESAFLGKTQNHTYSRVTNPSVQYFEERVKVITKAHNVTALCSGMAAISNVFFTLAQTGNNIVTTKRLFGNTYSFLVNTLKSFGIEVRFCDFTDAPSVSSAIDENTCAVFVEIIANPQMEVADLLMLSEIAHIHNVPLIADTTLIPFSIFSAFDFGVDIEIVSSTKYISGGGTSLGGLIIDYGKFDWNFSKKLKDSTSNSFDAFNFKLRKEVHRNLGAYMTAESAYMQSLGLETMNIRYNHQAGTCLQLARRLQNHPCVKSVNYPGLENNPFHVIALSQFGELTGAMLTFDLASRSDCFVFLNNLKSIRLATNLFDNRSLILHPASTIYGGYTKDQRHEMDIKENTIRLSVGLEDIDSLYEDIAQALK